MHIIAVDDEYLALMDLAEAIHEAVPDAETDGFQTPAEALEKAGKIQADVAFLDIEMGGVNGLELAKRLKDIYGKTNIIFVTAYSQYAVEAFSIYASGYLLKPVTAEKIHRAMEHLRYPISETEDKGIRVKAFGNFEVFADGKPLRFPRSKSKELFAYLIHKRGTGCTTRELAAVLYEEKPYTHSQQKQVQTVISAMMKTLEDAGSRDCVVRSYNRIAVDVNKIDCDYYRFLNWDIDAVNQYTGEYMANYSWSEFVIGYLNSRIN